MTVRALVLRGALAGLVAGLAAGAFAFAVAEPRIDAAISHEEQPAHAHTEHGAGHEGDHGEEDAPPVSRDQQKGFLFLATMLWGVGIGGLFGIAFAALRGRAGRVDGGTLALALCGVLVLAVVLVPALKYPPNPPGVGDPETIGRRTALYFLLLALSLIAVLAAWRASRRLGRGRPASIGVGIGAIVYLATIALVLALLPGFDEVPSDFPAQLLWEFRIASIGTQVTLWAVLGVSFAAIVEGSARSHRRPRILRATGPFQRS